MSESDAEEKYRVLFESTPLATFVVEQGSGRFCHVNEAAVRLYGYSRDEFAGMSIFDLGADDASPKRVVGPHAPSYGGVWKHRYKSGQVRDVELSVHPIALGDDPVLLVIATDVTEKKELAERLLHSQKMEAIARLAGGIAHDFNNLLSVVLVGSECVLQELGPDHPLQEDLINIRAAAMRASSLTHQLLAFSRREVTQPRVVQLNDVVAESEKILRRLLGEDIELQVSLDPELRPIEADPAHLSQVIINFVVNARDAMPSGGRLTIETKNVTLDQRRGDLEPGTYTMLSVRDTGVGMDAETISRIFDPFFTTKAFGKGIGLGLSAVFGIVKQSRGTIVVHSHPGRGTTFEVYLPCLDEKRARAVSQTPRGARLLLGAETVLLVEDDVNVRAVIRRTLRAHGYQVLEAENGERAILVCNQAKKVDLILSDVVMPGLDGPATVAAVRGIFPSIKVLYMSGYSEHPALSAGASEAPLLRKPFSVEDLIVAVRAAIDAPAP